MAHGAARRLLAAALASGVAAGSGSAASAVVWELTASAAVSNRSDAAMAWWRGGAWLMGGGNYSVAYNVWADVHVAASEGPWTRVTADAGWSPRAYAAAAVTADDALVMAGGGHCAAAAFNSSLCPSRANYTFFNDVWATADGRTWLPLGAGAWEPRGGHSLTTLASGTMVLAGGVTPTAQLADVWASDDGGASWACRNPAAPFGGRSFHGAAALGDTLVLAGGGTFTAAYNDVWASQDAGATWASVSPAAPWSPRFAFGLAPVATSTCESALLLTGGYVDYPEVGTADVWLSCDAGASWVMDTDAAPWGNRSFHNMVAAPPPRRDVVLFGGWNVVGVLTYHYLGDAWHGTLL